MIPGAAPVLVYFDGRVQCVFCAGDGAPCIVCNGSGVMDTLEAVDREDVEPAQFLEDAHG